MEEWVGERWHRFIWRAADASFPRAAVPLQEVQRPVQMLFRAGGGDPLVRVVPATAQKVGGARGWLQKLAGQGERAALSTLDEQTLALPPTIAVFDDRSRTLAGRFWPGALTMVLPLQKTARIAPAVTAGLDTIALRCPAHPVMRAVLQACGVPLAAPSANASGGVSPTQAAHVAASLGDAAGLVLDGGACAAGIESTIVALRDTGWQVLRPGPVTTEQLAEVLGTALAVAASERIEAPGQLASHYSPGKPVRLDAAVPAADEFLIGFGAVAGSVNLSPSGDLIEAAALLYECLHAAAASQHPRIAVAPIPAEGIGAAINDRLKRAAA
mgnify:CR=1 FL=1